MTEQSLDRLISKIQEDAKQQANAIVNEARISSEKLREERRKKDDVKAQKTCQEILRSARAEAENIVHRESVEAVIKSRWIILSEKQKIMDSVFNTARERLQSFAKEERYRLLLQRLIEKAAIAAGGGKLKLLVNSNDSQSKLPLKELSRMISSSLGVETTLDVAEETISAVGGVVVQSADNNTRIDNTFDSILDREKRRLEPKIMAILFPSKV